MPILRVSNIIESRHMTSIIACLYMRGKMGKSEIYNVISNSPNMARKLDVLVEEGLITSTTNGRRIEISLTDKGTTVAESLCDLEERMYGSVGDLQHFEDGECAIDGGRCQTFDWYGSDKRRKGSGPFR